MHLTSTRLNGQKLPWLRLNLKAESEPENGLIFSFLPRRCPHGTSPGGKRGCGCSGPALERLQAAGNGDQLRMASSAYLDELQSRIDRKQKELSELTGREEQLVQRDPTIHRPRSSRSHQRIVLPVQICVYRGMISTVSSRCISHLRRCWSRPSSSRGNQGTNLPGSNVVSRTRSRPPEVYSPGG